MTDPLRESLAAWQVAQATAVEAFERTRVAINKELDAVGGYVTSSASDKGFCQSYYRMEDGFGGGVERAGKTYGGTGPHANTVAPHLSEAGDRCRELERADRVIQLAAVAARNEVERIVKELIGEERAAGISVEHVTLAVLALTPQRRENTMSSYGILSDRAIVAAVTQGEIEIDPFNRSQVRPAYVDKKGKLNSASYDLTLGAGVVVYDQWVRTDVELAKPSCGLRLIPLYEVLDVKKEQPVTRFTIGDDGWVLLPGIGYLLHTHERILTKKYVPVLDGKSSIGRYFVNVHATAGYGDPGFDGQFTLEVTVTHPIRIYAGMRAAQIRFHTMVGEPLKLYDGNYKGETSMGAVPSAAWKMFQ